jgi:hypothetical protein
VEQPTHLHVAPKSRKCGSIRPLSDTPSWRSAKLVKDRDNFTFNLKERGHLKNLGVDGGDIKIILKEIACKSADLQDFMQFSFSDPQQLSQNLSLKSFQQNSGLASSPGTMRLHSVPLMALFFICK